MNLKFMIKIIEHIRKRIFVFDDSLNLSNNVH